MCLRSNQSDILVEEIKHMNCLRMCITEVLSESTGSTVVLQRLRAVGSGNWKVERLSKRKGESRSLHSLSWTKFRMCLGRTQWGIGSDFHETGFNGQGHLLCPASRKSRKQNEIRKLNDKESPSRLRANLLVLRAGESLEVPFRALPEEKKGGSSERSKVLVSWCSVSSRWWCSAKDR